MFHIFCAYCYCSQQYFITEQATVSRPPNRVDHNKFEGNEYTRLRTEKILYDIKMQLKHNQGIAKDLKGHSRDCLCNFNALLSEDFFEPDKKQDIEETNSSLNEKDDIKTEKKVVKHITKKNHNTDYVGQRYKRAKKTPAKYLPICE